MCSSRGAREGGTLPSLAPSTATRSVLAGTGITGNSTAAAGTISAYELWYCLGPCPFSHSLQDVTCHCCKASMCRQVVQLPAPPHCRADGSTPQHPSEDHSGIVLRSCSPGLSRGMEHWKALSCCKRMPRNPSGISVPGGAKADMANARLKVYEQCWKGERVAWRGNGQGCC